MDCPRCKGLCVEGWLNESQQDGPALPAQRCVACGWIADERIRQVRSVIAMTQAQCTHPSRIPQLAGGTSAIGFICASCGAYIP